LRASVAQQSSGLCVEDADGTAASGIGVSSCVPRVSFVGGDEVPSGTIERDAVGLAECRQDLEWSIDAIHRQVSGVHRLAESEEG
jgi:hypothetical protein